MSNVPPSDPARFPTRPDPQAPRRPADTGAAIDWVEAERPRLRLLRQLPVPVHLEQGLHPPEHVCAACSSARVLRRAAEEEGAQLLWVEVAHVVPGQEGIAAPPPWLRILAPGSETGPVRFLGTPRGDLLEGLVQVVQDVAGGTAPSDLSADWKAFAERTHRRHHFRIFASAKNSDAPSVVRALARFVHLRPERLALDVIDVEAFPEEARRRGVRHLPTVTIDDFAHFYGPPREDELLHAIEHVMPSGDLPYAGPKGESPFGGMS